MVFSGVPIVPTMAIVFRKSYIFIFLNDCDLFWVLFPMKGKIIAILGPTNYASFYH